MIAAAGAKPAAAEPLAFVAPLADGAVLDLPVETAPGLPTPADFLGYPLGSRFTHHHRILAYLDALAAASDRVDVERYGATEEGRPLVLVTVASPEMRARLDAVRRTNLELASGKLATEAASERIAGEQPVIVWLAYGVHGNESSSAEAAMATAYLLAAARGATAALLDRAVVLIDPLVNPDGRERYVSWYETQVGSSPDPVREASEHKEPWPGGRFNHYLFDLNRDWAWATQVETRQRIVAYRDWEPQVYVDFHEMSPESSYFFPPVAPPIHPELAPSLGGWLEVFGRGNAAAFDRQRWPFFVREVFDLFYPAYGDTYPGFRGAVGMTYEVAGGGRAGLAFDRRDGGRLALADRVARHTVTGLATVATAATHRQTLLADFVAARAGSGEALTYLWDATAPEAGALAEILHFHGVAVGRLPAARTLAVTARGGEATERSFAEGTFAVVAEPPLGGFVKALLEAGVPVPEAFAASQRRRVEDRLDPEFFDVTAWSLPLAYGVEVFRHPAAVDGLLARPASGGAVAGRGEVGYLLPPQGLAGYRAVAALLRQGAAARLATEAFVLADRSYPAGTVFVSGRDRRDGLDGRVVATATAEGVGLERVASSLSDEGPALGSASFLPLRAGRIGLVGGAGTTATSFGSLWFLLDRQLALPVTRLELGDLAELDLRRFDVLVFPDGDGYGRRLGDDGSEAVERWLRAGGTLVAVGDAFDWLRDRELTKIEEWKPPEEEEGCDPPAEGGLESRELLTPGAVLATELARAQPLAAGLPAPPAVLFEGTRVLRAVGDPRVDLLRAISGKDPVVAGFAWPEARERLRGALLVSTESVGEGRLVLFAEEPAFRAFWRGTAPLLANAVLLR